MDLTAEEKLEAFKDAAARFIALEYSEDDLSFLCRTHLRSYFGPLSPQERDLVLELLVRALGMQMDANPFERR